jgi:hypothetical protein
MVRVRVYVYRQGQGQKADFGFRSDKGKVDRRRVKR